MNTGFMVATFSIFAWSKGDKKAKILALVDDPHRLGDHSVLRVEQLLDLSLFRVVLKLLFFCCCCCFGNFFLIITDLVLQVDLESAVGPGTCKNTLFENVSLCDEYSSSKVLIRNRSHLDILSRTIFIDERKSYRTSSRKSVRRTGRIRRRSCTC